MTNILGGGGDFKHFLHHIGTAASGWLDDMDTHRFEFTSDNFDSFAENVEDWAKTLDVDSLEKERDQYLVDLVKAKSEAKYLK